MRIPLIALLTLLAALAAAQKSVDVRIKVIDPAGKPVANMTVGQMWIAEHPGDPFKARSAMTTGEDGIAAGSQTLNGPSAVLMAYDPAKNLGGFATVTEADAGKEVPLTVGPLTELKVNFEIVGWPGGRPDAFVNIFRLGDKSASCCLVQQMESKNAFLLPPGKYMVGMFSFDCSTYQKDVTVEAGKPVDLGTQKLEMSTLAKMWGKPAAEISLTDARGLPKTTKLADLKGKWVLLEFWGYW